MNFQIQILRYYFSFLSTIFPKYASLKAFNLFQKVKNIKLDKFPVMTYDDAVQNYGSDKPDLRYNIKFVELNDLEDDVIEQIEIEAKYAGYLDRQRMDIQDFEKEENLKIPKSTNYKLVGSLSNEIVEKLSKIKPPTLGAASRISGVTPAATIALLRYIKKNKNKKAA